MKKICQIKINDQIVDVYCKNKTFNKMNQLELDDNYLKKTFRKIHNKIKENIFTYYCGEQNIFLEIEYIRPSYYVILKIKRMNVYQNVPTGLTDVEIPSYETKMFLKTEPDGKEIFMSPLAAKKMKELRIKQHQIDLTGMRIDTGAYSSFVKDKVIEFYCPIPNEFVLVNIEEPDIYNFGLKVVKNEKN